MAVCLFQYKRSTSADWANIQVDEPPSYRICGYSPYEEVQIKLRAINSAGYSDIAISNTVRTHCTGK